jgi:hypothetical protein
VLVEWVESWQQMQTGYRLTLPALPSCDCEHAGVSRGDHVVAMCIVANLQRCTQGLLACHSCKHGAVCFCNAQVQDSLECRNLGTLSYYLFPLHFVLSF